MDYADTLPTHLPTLWQRPPLGVTAVRSVFRYIMTPVCKKNTYQCVASGGEVEQVSDSRHRLVDSLTVTSQRITTIHDQRQQLPIIP